MPVRYTTAIFSYRPFSLSTKILLSFGIIAGAVLGKLPGEFKHKIHLYLWNVADHRRHADYWFALLHLSMPWAYVPQSYTEGTIGCDVARLETPPTYIEAHFERFLMTGLEANK